MGVMQSTCILLYSKIFSFDYCNAVLGQAEKITAGSSIGPAVDFFLRPAVASAVGVHPARVRTLCLTPSFFLLRESEDVED